MNVTITENWSTGATAALMPQATALKAAGIKCVDVWLTPQDQAAFVQDLHSLGYQATVFGNDETNADDTYAKLAGDLADGTITAALTSGLHPSPALEAFREEYKKAFNLESTPFAETSYDALAGADALIVVTDWNEYRHPDFKRIKATLRRPVVVDGRNLYSPQRMAELGFVYHSIGRGVIA